MYLKVDRLADGCGGFFFRGCIIIVITQVKQSQSNMDLTLEYYNRYFN